MITRGSVLVVTLVLAACTGAPSNRSESTRPDSYNSRPVEQLLARQQYGEALALLARDARNPSAERHALLKKANELAQSYDRNTSAAMRDAAAQEDWAHAYGLLHEARRNYPEGPLIRDAIAELAPRQQARITQVQSQRLLDRAQWMWRERSSLEDLAVLDPGNTSVAAELAELRVEAQTLALHLSNLGVAALNERKLELAEKCLTASDRLHPLADNVLALERLDRMRHEINQERRARKQRDDQERARAEAEKRRSQLRADEERHQQEAARLVDEFRAAMARPDLPRAEATLNQLRELDRMNPQVPTLERAYTNARDTRVDELLERGNTLYSNGDVEGARDVWEEASQLDPEHPRVRDRLLRVEQVLDNLRDKSRRTATP